MSNILPGKVSAGSWKRAVGTGKLSPFACLSPQSAGESSQEQEEAWGWSQGERAQSQPAESAGGVPGASEREGGRCMARQEAQVGGGSPGPPPERGWKPEPGRVLPEAACFGKEVSWRSTWCVELLTLGNRTALREQVPAIPRGPTPLGFSPGLNLPQRNQDWIPNSRVARCRGVWTPLSRASTTPRATTHRNARGGARDPPSPMRRALASSDPQGLVQNQASNREAEAHELVGGTSPPPDPAPPPQLPRAVSALRCQQCSKPGPDPAGAGTWGLEAAPRWQRGPARSWSSAGGTAQHPATARARGGRGTADFAAETGPASPSPAPC